ERRRSRTGDRCGRRRRRRSAIDSEDGRPQPERRRRRADRGRLPARHHLRAADRAARSERVAGRRAVAARRAARTRHDGLPPRHGRDRARHALAARLRRSRRPRDRARAQPDRDDGGHDRGARRGLRPRAHRARPDARHGDRHGAACVPDRAGVDHHPRGEPGRRHRDARTRDLDLSGSRRLRRGGPPARGDLRRVGPGGRRRPAPDHRSPPAAPAAAAAARLLHAERRVHGPARGGPRLPRLRRAAAHPVLGLDDLRGARPVLLPVADHRAGPLPRTPRRRLLPARRRPGACARPRPAADPPV
ncbi:MAG: Dipeptide transport system permease protein DppC, partial [uncultured Thermoleophilia bacterium]